MPTITYIIMLIYHSKLNFVSMEKKNWPIGENCFSFQHCLGNYVYISVCPYW